MRDVGVLLEKVHALDDCAHPAEPYLMIVTNEQLQQWSGDIKKRQSLLYCISRMAPAMYGPWLVPVLTASLRDERPAVRELAIGIAAVAGLHDLIPALRFNAVNDPVPHIARYAELVAADLRCNNG